MNENLDVCFSDKEKIAAFDKLTKLFYDKNFGQTSKTDFELWMFHFLMEHIVNGNQNESGVLDYNVCSDYRLSKILGITQQRVRSLKVKNQIVHPIDFSWRESFRSLEENARYDSKSNKIQIYIPDPNLCIEIENFIVEQGGYIETQLNKNLLQMRVEYYIELLVSMEMSPDDKEKAHEKIRKEIKRQMKIANSDERFLEEKSVGKMMMETGADIASIVSCLNSLTSPGSFIALAFNKLESWLRR